MLRPSQRAQTTGPGDRDNVRTIGRQTQCPFGHDANGTTTGRLACDQHDRPTQTSIVHPRSAKPANRINTLFLTNLVCVKVTTTQLT